MRPQRVLLSRTPPLTEWLTKSRVCVDWGGRSPSTMPVPISPMSTPQSGPQLAGSSSSLGACTFSVPSHCRLLLILFLIKG